MIRRCTRSTRRPLGAFTPKNRHRRRTDYSTQMRRPIGGRNRCGSIYNVRIIFHHRKTLVHTVFGLENWSCCSTKPQTQENTVFWWKGPRSYSGALANCCVISKIPFESTAIIHQIDSRIGFCFSFLRFVGSQQYCKTTVACLLGSVSKF